MHTKPEQHPVDRFGERLILALAVLVIAGIAFGWFDDAHAQGIDAVPPLAARETPHLELGGDTRIVKRDFAGAPVLRVLNDRGAPSLNVKADGTIELAEGAVLSFDPAKVYTRAGPRLGFVPVRIGDFTVLLGVYELPDVNGRPQ